MHLPRTTPQIVGSLLRSGLSFLGSLFKTGRLVCKKACTTDGTYFPPIFSFLLFFLSFLSLSYHFREGMTGCVVTVYSTRSEAEQALMKLQSTNANASSVPVISPVHSQSAHSPSTPSSVAASQKDLTSPPVYASQPASQPSSVSQPASTSPVADASLPAPSSPTDGGYSPKHLSPPDPTSSVRSGSPSASGARPQSATFNGHLGEDNHHAHSPVDRRSGTASSSPASLSLSFSVSGDAVGTLIRTISEKVLMTAL